MPRSRNYQELLIESLKDRKEALAYLNAVIEETKDGSEESQKLLMAGNTPRLFKPGDERPPIE